MPHTQTGIEQKSMSLLEGIRTGAPIPDQLELRDILNNPHFEAAGKTHDWRNHVPSAIQEQWRELSVEARVVAYGMASNLADQEEWD